jgi:hypothetical protein
MEKVWTDEGAIALANVTRERAQNEPRIESACIEGDQLVVRFRGPVVEGATASFRARALPVSALITASDAQLQAVRATPSGEAIIWSELGVGFTTGQLLEAGFGLKSAFAAHQAKAGRVRTPAKSAASRANGAKGGRPRKTPVAG